jgi:hypothetical protein
MSSKATDQPSKLNFDALKEKPRLVISIHHGDIIMAANEKYLLCCPEGQFLLIDEQGNEKLSIQRGFYVNEICWSSYLNQFLILSGRDRKLYALEINAQQLQQIKEFDQSIITCTCNGETFMVVTEGGKSKIEKYNLSNWQLECTFDAPVVDADEYVQQIQFNSNGTRLGLILGDAVDRPWDNFWFELRDPHDMSRLQKVTGLGYAFSSLFFSLPLNQEYQYLASICSQNKIFLLDSDGKLKETLEYDNAKEIMSVALINGSCLVIRTAKPGELHFHDL